ncbi:MAG: flagellar biosynthetic protein FliR [Legionellales bacterium]
MTLSLPWLNTLFFIVIRLGTLLLFTPIQAISKLPIQTRLVFIFALGLLLANHQPSVQDNDTTNLLLGALAEFSNGLILASSIYAAFAVFQIAGQIIDNETGFNSIALFNPSEHSQESLSSHLLSMLAVLFFFGLDGHIWLFKGLTYSFVLIPPGSLTLFSGFTPVVKQFGFMFSIAFMIASPIVLTLLIIDLCGALVTRNMPQVSTYFLTLPIKILLGLFLFSMTLNYFTPISNAVFERCFQTWQEVMS